MACLVATGVDDVRVSVEAMKLGADDCIVKPFRLETIALAVERALHEKRLELEVEAHRKQLEQTAKAQTEQLQAAVESIQQMYDEIQRTSEETAKELSAALAAKHNDTDQHAHGVTHYSVEIAKALGCTPEQLNLISRGSYLHDIGKIGIPDAILNKPGKLTPQEVALMQTHPRKGYEIICRIPFLKEAAEIVLSHHERFDGRGYPRGLTGDDIPLGARIVAVAEAFDVLICDQPYRKGLDLEDAVAEIRRSSGAQFDPKAVTAFLDWVKIHGHHRARHSQRDAVSGDPLEPSRPA
jgi:putative nucleotidyltransferase with HDIG domain